MRRVLASVIALVSACMAAGPLAVTASAASTTTTTTTADPRASRAALLVRIGELTDEMQSTDAGVVAAHMRATAAFSALTEARGRMRDRAVQAYVIGTGSRARSLAAPSAYL